VLLLILLPYFYIEYNGFGSTLLKVGNIVHILCTILLSNLAIITEKNKERKAFRQ